MTGAGAPGKARQSKAADFVALAWAANRERRGEDTIVFPLLKKKGFIAQAGNIIHILNLLRLSPRCIMGKTSLTAWKDSSR